MEDVNLKSLLERFYIYAVIQMIFELMHKNIPVADVSLNEEGRMEHILAIRDLTCVLSFRDADSVNSTGRLHHSQRHTNRVYVDSCVFSYTFDMRGIASEISSKLGIKFRFKV